MKRSYGWALTVALVAAGGCGSGNLGSTPQETSKLQLDNLKEMKATLETIKDDSTASAALSKIEQQVARQNALKKKMESYNLSFNDAMAVMKDTASEMMGIGMGLATAQLNAVQKAPGKAGEIQAVMQKMNDGKTAITVNGGGPNVSSGPIHAGPKKH